MEEQSLVCEGWGAALLSRRNSDTEDLSAGEGSGRAGKGRSGSWSYGAPHHCWAVERGGATAPGQMTEQVQGLEGETAELRLSMYMPFLAKERSEDGESIP